MDKFCFVCQGEVASDGTIEVEVISQDSEFEQSYDIEEQTEILNEEFEEDSENEVEYRQGNATVVVNEADSDSKENSCKVLDRQMWMQRRIQKTLFQSVLQIDPKTKLEGNEREENKAQVILCTACNKAIYEIWGAQMRIRKLQRDMERESEKIVNTVISSVVLFCLTNGTGITENCDWEYFEGKINAKVLEKILPRETDGFKIYKKWRSKFCQTFSAKLEELKAIASVEDSEVLPQQMEPESYAHEVDVENYDDLMLLPEDEDIRMQNTITECEEVTVTTADLTDDETESLCLSAVSIPECGSASEMETIVSINESNHKSSISTAKTENTGSQGTAKARTRKPNTTAKDVTYACEACGKTFTRKARLREHMDNFHDETKVKRFKCPECPGQFSKLKQLQIHVEEEHKEVGLILCTKCKAMYKATEGEEEHECKTFSRSCRRCQEHFTSRNLYRVHRERTCEESETVKESKIIHCGMCSKTFLRKQALEYHIKTHTGERPFTCEFCSKSFVNRAQLNIHKRIHTGEKPYVCDQCGQNFSSMPGLASHLKTHTGVKPYNCEACGKSFRSAGHLAKHKLIHSGERPFSCTICRKSFNRKENLRAHEYTHATLKPHKCPHCPNVSYARASVLRKHIADAHRAPAVSNKKTLIIKRIIPGSLDQFQNIDGSKIKTELIVKGVGGMQFLRRNVVPKLSMITVKRTADGKIADSSSTTKPEVNTQNVSSSKASTAGTSETSTAKITTSDEPNEDDVSFVQESLYFSGDGGQYIIFKEMPTNSEST